MPVDISAQLMGQRYSFECGLVREVLFLKLVVSEGDREPNTWGFKDCSDCRGGTETWIATILVSGDIPCYQPNHVAKLGRHFMTSATLLDDDPAGLSMNSLWSPQTDLCTGWCMYVSILVQQTFLFSIYIPQLKTTACKDGKRLEHCIIFWLWQQSWRCWEEDEGARRAVFMPVPCLPPVAALPQFPSLDSNCFQGFSAQIDFSQTCGWESDCQLQPVNFPPFCFPLLNSNSTILWVHTRAPLSITSWPFGWEDETTYDCWSHIVRLSMSEWDAQEWNSHYGMPKC